MMSTNKSPPPSHSPSTATSDSDCESNDVEESTETTTSSNEATQDDEVTDDVVALPTVSPATVAEALTGSLPPLLGRDGMWDALTVAFEFIPSVDLLVRVQLTCRSFRALLLPPGFWRRRWAASVGRWMSTIVAFDVAENRELSSPNLRFSYWSQAPSMSLPKIVVEATASEGAQLNVRRMFSEGVVAPLVKFLTGTTDTDVTNRSAMQRACVYFGDEPNARSRHDRRKTRFRASFFDEEGNVTSGPALQHAVMTLFNTELKHAMKEAFAATQLASYDAPFRNMTAPVTYAFGQLFPVFLNTGCETFKERYENRTTFEDDAVGPELRGKCAVALRVDGVVVKPLFPLRHIVLYQYLLTHTVVTDINQHCFRETEEKFACCTRITSPTGATVEMRFFLSCLGGSFPRVYAKCIYCPSTFPDDIMPEKFESDPGMRTDIFTGGFGRVEVDVRPIVSRKGLDEVARLLQLPGDFPPHLLWNVVMAGCGGFLRLSRHTSSFVFYYRYTLAQAFEDAMQTPDGERFYPVTVPGNGGGGAAAGLH